MKLIDANVLIYATDADAYHHAAAHSWLDRALGGTEPIAFSWVVLLAFVRITTHPGVAATPLNVDEATGVVEQWLQQPAAVVVHPTRRHLALVRGLLTSSGTAGNLVNDAHLAALALEHGAQIVSFDRDFLRFGVPWSSP